MNSPDKFFSDADIERSSLPGLDVLRSEVASPDLHPRIVLVLLPTRSGRRRRVLKLSLATVFAILLVAAALLAPRASLASAVTKVLKALQAVVRYHIKSYVTLDGQRHLTSETWVNGSKRKVVIYGPDGKPLPDSQAMGDVAANMDKDLKSLPPQQLMDPKLTDKLSKEAGSLGPDSGFVTMTITVDGKEVTDLPDDVKKAIASGSYSGGSMLSTGGEDDVTYLRGLLSDEKRWVISGGQIVDGKRVDRYRSKGADKGVILLVDPASSLPVRLTLTTTAMGQSITTEDNFDYPSSGP